MHLRLLNLKKKKRNGSVPGEIRFKNDSVPGETSTNIFFRYIMKLLLLLLPHTHLSVVCYELLRIDCSLSVAHIGVTWNVVIVMLK